MLAALESRLSNAPNRSFTLPLLSRRRSCICVWTSVWPNEQYLYARPRYFERQTGCWCSCAPVR
jgi:hypothetical protein